MNICRDVEAEFGIGQEFWQRFFGVENLPTDTKKKTAFWYFNSKPFKNVWLVMQTFYYTI